MSAWSGVVVVAVALAVALVAVGQPAWTWSRSTGAGYETWSYGLFGVTHTVHNDTAGTMTNTTFAYAAVPGQGDIAAVFATVQYAFLAMVVAAFAAAGLSVATARRKLRGIFAGASLVAACLLALLVPVYLVLNLPAAAGVDLPELNGQPVSGFEGQATLPQATGSPILVSWGPGFAWYVVLILALVFAFGATEMWSLRPAKRPVARAPRPQAAARLPPPEPPAPPREEPELEEVFIIGSNGLLIKHMSRTLMSEKDRDVVGGMIGIVSNFVRETFSERDGGSVQEITMGQHRFVLCNDSGIVVAVLVTRGATDDIVPRLRHLIALLVDRYGGALEDWGGEPLEGIEDEIVVLWQPFFLPPPPAD